MISFLRLFWNRVTFQKPVVDPVIAGTELTCVLGPSMVGELDAFGFLVNLSLALTFFNHWVKVVSLTPRGDAFFAPVVNYSRIVLWSRIHTKRDRLHHRTTIQSLIPFSLSLSIISLLSSCGLGVEAVLSLLPSSSLCNSNTSYPS